MSTDAKETFLIVIHSRSSDFVMAFVQQCSYESVYQLPHDAWDVSVFLLQGEPKSEWSHLGYGQELVRVENFAMTNKITDLLTYAAHLMSRLPPAQKRLELERAFRLLEREGPPAGLSFEEMQQLRRTGPMARDTGGYGGL